MYQCTRIRTFMSWARSRLLRIHSFFPGKRRYCRGRWCAGSARKALHHGDGRLAGELGVEGRQVVVLQTAVGASHGFDAVQRELSGQALLVSTKGAL